MEAQAISVFCVSRVPSRMTLGVSLWPMGPPGPPLSGRGGRGAARPLDVMKTHR